LCSHVYYEVCRGLAHAIRVRMSYAYVHTYTYEVCAAKHTRGLAHLVRQYLYFCTRLCRRAWHTYPQDSQAHFTCVTGTKVQILTRTQAAGCAGSHFTCFTGTQVQILTRTQAAGCAGGLGTATRRTHRFSFYLLYWYNSTNTDAED
jgi:hypothetical protein